jgi:hypothetical protein
MIRRLVRRLRRPTRVLEPSEYPDAYFDVDANYYYFGHHKCATNWMRSFLMGLCREIRMNYLIYRGDNRTNVFSPGNRASFHLYVNSWPGDLQKLTDGDRGFHLIRDPRDALVSTYFSWRYSHRIADEKQRRIRQDLKNLDVDDGLLYTLEHFYYYDGIVNWELGSHPRVLDVRYEDLVANEFGVFRQITSELEIEIADEALRAITDACSFRALSGRKRGRENRQSHFRKGVAGDWKNYFGSDGPLKQAVYDKLEGLIVRLGYEP